MRHLIFLFFLLILISSCREDEDNQPIDIIISSKNNRDINFGDTIEIPVKANLELSAYAGTGEYLYFWDFGDSTNSQNKQISHSYQTNGIYEVQFKVKNENFNGEFFFFVKVIGKYVGDTNAFREGLFVFNYNSVQYTFTRDQNKQNLFLANLNSNEIIEQKIDFIGYTNSIDIIKDKENNFFILGDGELGTIDLNGNTISKSGLLFGTNWHIYNTSENKFNIIANDRRKIIYSTVDNSGSHTPSQELFDYDNSDYTCLDARFINDFEYLLLLDKNEFYEFPYDTAKVSLFKRNLLNTNEIRVILPQVFFNNIVQTASGYLLYGFDIEWNCGDCESYFNIIKLNNDLEYEWHKILNMYNLDLYNFNDKVNFIEYSNNYYLFQDNVIFCFDLSGNIKFKKEYFKYSNFEFNSVSISDNGFYVLGTDTYISNSLWAKLFPIVFRINEEGKIIE